VSVYLKQWGPYEVLQTVLVLMFGGVAVFLLVSTGEIPKELWGIEGMIIGFFFSRAAQNGTLKHIEQQLARQIEASLIAGE
jgi:hypothetical protein